MIVELGSSNIITNNEVPAANLNSNFFWSFTRAYFAQKEILKNILTFQGVTYFFTGGIVKNKSSDM